MIRSLELQGTLSQFVSDGVMGLFLVSVDGRLFAFSRGIDLDVSHLEVISSVCANAHREYTTASAGNFDNSDIDYLILDLDATRICVKSIDEAMLLVVLSSSATVKTLKEISSSASEAVKLSMNPLPSSSSNLVTDI